MVNKMIIKILDSLTSICWSWFSIDTFDNLAAAFLSFARLAVYDNWFHNACFKCDCKGKDGLCQSTAQQNKFSEFL